MDVFRWLRQFKAFEIKKGVVESFKLNMKYLWSSIK